MFLLFNFLSACLALSLFLPTIVAFTFIPGSPSECDNLSISWTGERLQVLRNIQCFNYLSRRDSTFSTAFDPRMLSKKITPTTIIFMTEIGLWSSTKYNNTDLSVQQWIWILFYGTPDAGSCTIPVNNVGCDRLQFRWNHSCADCRSIYWGFFM
jgi:hypothetical protein